MLSISDIKIGTVITYREQPYVVVKAEHLKMGRGGAVLKTKIKNLVSGDQLPVTFQSSESIEPAEIERRKASFLYAEGSEYHFMESDSYEQFFLDKSVVEAQIPYLKEGLDVDVLKFDGSPVAINLPTKVTYTVKDAPPGVKGDSAGSVTKQITLENDLTIQAPLFIKTGEDVVVNTETGNYVERA
ncbi:MAG: elongation factor P [Patescibacteria group bacterium]